MDPRIDRHRPDPALGDRQLTDQSLPIAPEITVDGARSVLGAIAVDLITSITLLLSMMLVAVQLADLQFLPRSIRRLRLGNRTVQHAVGSVLDTTVFCPRALRSTRSFGEDAVAVVTHLSVLVAVTLRARSLRRSTSSTASTEPNPTLSRSEWNPARRAGS